MIRVTSDRVSDRPTPPTGPGWVGSAPTDRPILEPVRDDKCEINFAPPLQQVESARSQSGYYNARKDVSSSNCTVPAFISGPFDNEFVGYPVR